MIRMHDKDKDGTLSKDEAANMKNGAKYDKDGDGKVTQDEIVDGLKNWKPGGDSTSGSDTKSSTDTSKPAESSATSATAASASSAPSTSAGDSGSRNREYGSGRENRGSFGGFGGRGRGFGGDRRRGDSFGGGSGERSSSGPAIRRFHVPSKTLPEKLSQRFFGKDIDGDGQIQMHEFDSNWSDSKVEEFNRFDRDGDGVITAQEAATGGF
jgi:Ca2+-binding EF-hand superfamily protein